MAEPDSRRGALRRLGAAVLAASVGALLPHRLRAYGLIQCTPGVTQCPPSTECIAGFCLQPYQSSYCPTGFSYCYGQCINTQSDPNHCGGCNIQCPFGIPCTFGACTIEVLPSCGNTLSDPNNCGRCGNVCTAAPGAVATCSNGVCGAACPAGFHTCSTGACVPSGTCCTNTDCPSGQTCVGGACTGAAQAPICDFNASQTVSGSNPTTTGGEIAVAGTGTGTLVLTPCAPPSGGAATFGPYFDVKTAGDSSFSAVQITVCGAQQGNGLIWLPTGGIWQPVTPAPTFNAETGCLTVTLTASSSPTVAQLVGTKFAFCGAIDQPCCSQSPLLPACLYGSCHDGVCTCPPGESFCGGIRGGTACCFVGDECVSGVCCLNDMCTAPCTGRGTACYQGIPNGPADADVCCQAAGATSGTCCGNGQTCVNGACCDNGSVCGGACCSKGECACSGPSCDPGVTGICYCPNGCPAGCGCCVAQDANFNVTGSGCCPIADGAQCPACKPGTCSAT